MHASITAIAEVFLNFCSRICDIDGEGPVLSRLPSAPCGNTTENSGLSVARLPEFQTASRGCMQVALDHEELCELLVWSLLTATSPLGSGLRFHCKHGANKIADTDQFTSPLPSLLNPCSCPWGGIAENLRLRSTIFKTLPGRCPPEVFVSRPLTLEYHRARLCCLEWNVIQWSADHELLPNAAFSRNGSIHENGQTELRKHHKIHIRSHSMMPPWFSSQCLSLHECT